MVSMKDVITYGTFYYPAYKHYNNPEANVECDNCGSEQLKSCVGYDKYDICMKCTDSLSNMFYRNLNTLTKPTQPIHPIYPIRFYIRLLHQLLGYLIQQLDQYIDKIIIVKNIL